ncbi:MAG: hypothetical protein J6E41_02485 [Lachnospiraceae bacterium]|nr:hypothetical protein [Lachnospiraceae bacterium]
MLKSKKLLKILLTTVTALTLFLAMAMAAAAEVIPALDEYNVKYAGGDKLESNFRDSAIYLQASSMQPGDSTDIVLNVRNEYSDTTDWYMTNDVIKTLEDTRQADALSGGAYTYQLSYKNLVTGKEKTIFSSDMVGGDSVSQAGEGLHEATDALKDWFYLDTLESGQNGVLTLHIMLDGETQGNDYQDTLAELKMRFAIELREPGEKVSEEKPEKEPEKEPDQTGKKKAKKSSGSSSSKTKVVKTGDDTVITPYLIAAGVSGLALLILAIYSLRQRRRQRGGRA